MTRESAFFVVVLGILAAPVAEAQHEWPGSWAPPEGSVAPRSAPQIGVKTTVSDPVGDTFGLGAVQHDIVELTAEFSSTALMIQVVFAAPISPADSGDPDAVVGFIDLDTDQNPATGEAPVTEVFCPAPSGLGTEFFLDLGSFSSATGEANLEDSGGVVGTVPVVFASDSFTATIPLALLADDGVVDTATVLGTLPEPTDCAPNGGSITSSPTAASVLEIPTASSVGLILLAALLAAAGLIAVRRGV